MLLINHGVIQIDVTLYYYLRMNIIKSSVNLCNVGLNELLEDMVLLFFSTGLRVPMSCT